MQKYYLSISEFSRMTGIPRKTLIYYDKIGLVKPALIQENGYRRYTAQQANTVSVIQGLRLLNMPLEEIRRYLDERTPASSLELFKRQATQYRSKLIDWNKSCLLYTSPSPRDNAWNQLK